MRDEPNASLDSLRHELEEIDRALVLLVAARVSVANAAIELRSRTDGCLTDPAQEERVLARARTWAELTGVSPESIEAIFRVVVASGKARFLATRQAEGMPAEPAGRTLPVDPRATRGRARPTRH